MSCIISIASSILPQRLELPNTSWAYLDALLFILWTSKSSLYHMGNFYQFGRCTISHTLDKLNGILNRLHVCCHSYFFFKLCSSELIVQNAILTLDLSKISVIYVLYLCLYTYIQVTKIYYFLNITSCIAVYLTVTW